MGNKFRELVSLLSVSALSSYILGLTWTVLPVIQPYILNTKEVGGVGYYGVLNFILVASAAICSGFIYSKLKQVNQFVFLKVGVFFLSATNVLFFVAQNDLDGWWLVLSQMVLGISISFVFSGLGSIFPLLKQRISPAILAGIFTCVNLGSMSSPLIFKYCSDELSWGSVCLAYGVAGLVVLTTIISKGSKARIDFPKELKVLEIVSNPLVVFFSLVVFLYSILEVSVSAFLPVYMTSELGISVDGARTILSFFWGVVSVSQFSAFLICRKIRPVLLYLCLSFFLLVGFFCVFLLKTNILFPVFCIALGCSAFFALTVTHAEWEFPDSPKETASLLVMLYFLGSGAGSLGFGWLISHYQSGMKIGYEIATIISCVVVIGISYYFTRKIKGRVD